ncbi:DUF2971 domain-containing protein [Cystobacter ferrugineus]|uniref:DUF2971 domain-containing protein n=1 Tax=Cystobacter ferrugineus TaxID=83449 RepID=UPI0009FDC641|nr:DUF2971 domain-containing protein [Cystobacter ferrugineus]
MNSIPEAVVEWCFVVRCEGGEGEVRVRSDGAVVFTAGPPGWVCLDGIRYPTSGSTLTRVLRNDVFCLDSLQNLEGTALASKAFLFHYTKSETAIRHILPNQTLRLSTYAGTNDPRESKDWAFTLVSPEGIAPPGEAIHVSKSLSQALKHHSRLACFCSDGLEPAQNQSNKLYDTNGWTRARMWAQYADNHRGVVLVFDRRRLIENARKSLHGKGTLFFGNVLYAEQGHSAEMLPFTVDYLQWRASSAKDFAEQHLKQHRDWLFFTKHIDWAQEHECRLVLHGASNTHEYISIKDALVEVCVGDAISDNDFTELRLEASKSGCPISRVFWRNGMPIRSPV